MRTLHLREDAARNITQYGSRGFLLSPLLAGEISVHAVFVRLQAGAVIGRHPAASEQLLLVVDGEVLASGEEGEPERLGIGDAALWEAGETHETTSPQGARALIFEGDGIFWALR